MDVFGEIRIFRRPLDYASIKDSIVYVSSQNKNLIHLLKVILYCTFIYCNLKDKQLVLQPIRIHNCSELNKKTYSYI